MAFTQQNEKDGYLFFAIAFNAVPGKTYAAQVVEAYNAGLTTQQIVNNYTSKPAFEDIYGADLSNADFAQAFVANVTAGLTAPLDPAVLNKAIADVTAALDAGLSKGDVITNVITNITNKSVADAEWGPLVQMLANKVAVAKALTEGEYAIDTEDVGALQAPLAVVTEEFDSVQDGINEGASLKVLLANALTAAQAVETYADGLGLKDSAGDPITGSADVEDELEARLEDAAQDALGVSYSTYDGMSATAKAQAIAAAKTDAANNIALAKEDLDTANAEVNKVATLAKKGAGWDAAIAATQAAQKAFALAQIDAGKQFVDYNFGKAPAAQLVDDVIANGDFKIDGKSVINVKAGGSFEFDADATAEQQAGLKAFLDALNASAAAKKAADAAADKEAAAKAAVDALDVAAGGAAGSGAAEALLGAAKTAKENLAAEQKDSADLDKALSDLSTYEAELNKLADLQKAAADADQKLIDAGFTKVDLDGTPVTLDAAKKELAIFDKDSVDTVLSAGFSSNDHIYVGSDYVLNASVTKDTDLSKGDASKLEVFFVETSTGTDVYIEHKAFGSNASGSDDIAKITLTGVSADKLVLKDGMITVAA